MGIFGSKGTENEMEMVLFRGVPWGASAQQIIDTEGVEPFDQTENLIGFMVKVGGLEALAGYTMAGDQYVRGGYRFVQQHTYENDFIADFQRIDEIVSKQHGQPAKSNKVWRDSLYRENPEDWGLAVSAGHLVYQTVWMLGDVKILHQLIGDNFEVTHLLEYTHGQYDAIEDAHVAKRNARDF